MNLVSERGDARLAAVVPATLTLALVALLLFAGRAQAAELVYWDNYRASPASVSVANIDGSGGGAVNLSGITLIGPEGMAFDSATGRLFIASNEGGPTGDGQIVFAHVDGSGAGVLGTPGAEVNDPYGVAIDPTTRTIYWVNGSGGVDDKGSIGFARLDGLGGGILDTAGVEIEEPYRLAIDPISGKVFWGDVGTTPNSIGFANLDNTGGGGTLSLPSATSSLYGMAVDSAAGRVYWLDSTNGDEKLLYVNIDGSGSGEIALAGAVNKQGYGLAIDPLIGRVYWANYGEGVSAPEALGFVNLAGGGGSVTPTTAPVNGAQDPVILKSPSGTGAPTLTQHPHVPAQLACSTGSWGGDYPGSFVYQAPRSLTHQWIRNGVAIPGATAPTFTATAGGSYACAVTATNQAGSATQTSAAVTLEAARQPGATQRASRVKLTTKRKAKADPGDRVTFRVRAVNKGDLPSRAARICVKLPKAARDDLRKPKCKKLAPLGGLAKRTVKFRIKVKRGADKGADKLTFQLKGTPGKAAKSRIIVR